MSPSAIAICHLPFLFEHRQHTDDDREEHRAFDHRGRDDHRRRDLPGSCRLPCHRLDRRSADPAGGPEQTPIRAAGLRAESERPHHPYRRPGAGSGRDVRPRRRARRMCQRLARRHVYLHAPPHDVAAGPPAPAANPLARRHGWSAWRGGMPHTDHVDLMAGSGAAAFLRRRSAR